MKRDFKILFVSILSLPFFFYGCDAPLNNPLDPENPDNKLAVIEGVVKTVSFPNDPISGVTVYWEQGNRVLSTDSDGYFKINNLQKKDGWLKLSESGFSSDSIYIEWNSREKVTLQVLLNAKPVLDSLLLYTIVENGFQLTPRYALFAGVHVSDIDGPTDIAGVYIQIPDIGIRLKLNYNVNNSFYEARFSPAELSIKSLDDLIGKEINVIADDLDNREFIIGSSMIKRIIKEDIELLSPINNQNVSDPVILNWKKFNPGFEFHYMLRVYTNTSPPDLVWQEDNIDMDEIIITVEESLEPGEYFWECWIIDKFNNRSKSKPASFSVNN